MMIPENSLAVYKNKPALVHDTADGKILISLSNGEQLKVREKDIELIHPGPLRDLNIIAANIDGSAAGGASGVTPDAIREAWELTLEESGPLSLKELAELAFGEYSPVSAWAAFRLILDGLYFTGSPAAIIVRPQEEVETEEQKRAEKQREIGERERFLERLKSRSLELPADSRFMQDVEALAYGKSLKSRTMKDIGLSETPEDAHALLLDTGCWDSHINPYPCRFGLSVVSAQCRIEPPPLEERRDMRHLAAFAIDSPWSNDPDDAVSIERNGEQWILYVHVADPASVIGADSEAEREARDRGATLYLPEGSARMLADEALPLFALGLSESSPALTFKMTLNNSGEIAETEIFPSTVSVQRLTYEKTDSLLETSISGETVAPLRDLYALAERNLRRRIAAGAVSIDLPETRISLNQGQVCIEPVIAWRSADMVRECMLLAGEGAGLWAAARNLPFPFVSQEIGDLPKEILPGMAGSCQLRRCMRPRTLSVKPGRHWGLGLDI
ncbi:MAG: RNB domain-containing ribonuclease, partial [Treponema sp.]|nr:RNB domain-containing ribonuclease [Treponema sp.]